jgi:hypothetical protein
VYKGLSLSTGGDLVEVMIEIEVEVEVLVTLELTSGGKEGTR